jgi:hypothetical protein
MPKLDIPQLYNYVLLHVLVSMGNYWVLERQVEPTFSIQIAQNLTCVIKQCRLALSGHLSSPFL